MFGDHLQAAAQARRRTVVCALSSSSPGKRQFGGFVSLLGTGFSRIRVAMAGGVLLTLAAVALGLGSTWMAPVAADNSVPSVFRPAEKPHIPDDVILSFETA